ncbi:MAG: hypothetical protein M3Z85_11700, partial [Acidobacteriota bacterium]|nr:hypothetical protein [Acidobacteriota bacterium]
TGFRPQPLVVGVPLSLWDANQPHDLLLRYAGFRIDLFVDGVLIDEEWPIGTLGAHGVKSVTAAPAIGEIAVWNRLLADGEIERKAGGADIVAQREKAMFGPEDSTLQYWRPRGYNTSAGDAMPFFHDGTLHVFFLLDRRHHGSKWGLGAHQWGHVSTTDLSHWKHYPPALTITEEWEGSICTGSAFFHNGRYYAFYATRMPDRSERLGMATSQDGVHFEKQMPTPFAEPAEPYRRGPNRDPFVFADGGQFRMLVTAELAHPGVAQRGGAIEQLISDDLKTWTPIAVPFLAPGYFGHQPECSDLFFWRGWYYLLFGQDGATHYRMAKSSTGPWIAPAVDILDGPQARVMKTAPFSGDRRIGVAFAAQGGFGGNLLFRELVQLPDGSLGTTFPAEMMPATGEPVASKGGATVRASEGFGAVALESLPENARIAATLTASAGTMAFGLVLRGEEDIKSGLQLRFQPALRRVAWLPVEATSLTVTPLASLEGVNGFDNPIQLEVITKGDLFDVSINGVRTLAHRAPNLAGKRLFIFAHNGELTVSNLVIRRLR